MLIKVICLMLSLCCTGLAIYNNAKHDRFMTLIFICLGIMLIMPIIVGFFGDMMGGLILTKGSGEHKEDFSGILSLLQDDETSKAINKLEELIQQKPSNIRAKTLLQKIYYEQLHNNNKALKVFFSELETEKLSEAHEEMIQLSIDILLEEKRTKDAKTLIKQCLVKVPSGFLQQKLQQRLKHL